MIPWSNWAIGVLYYVRYGKSSIVETIYDAFYEWIDTNIEVERKKIKIYNSITQS